MNRLKISLRARSLTRDLTSSIFRDSDIYDYMNEGIDRVRQLLPQLKDMVYLDVNTDEPILLPPQYHSLLSIYTASRLFFQDERQYQATTLMNEFEQKMEELRMKLEGGEVSIIDASGKDISSSLESFYVKDNYFDEVSDGTDLDDGVEGVE